MVKTASQKPSLSERTIEQHEEVLTKHIEYCTYIITGLENYAPYQKIVDVFRENAKSIDDSWHFVNEPAKLEQLRVAKMAYMTLIDYIPNLKMDRHKFQSELTKIQDPEE